MQLYREYRIRGEIIKRDFKYTSTEYHANVTTQSRHSITLEWSHLSHTRHKLKVVLPIRTKDIKQTKRYPTRIVRRSQQGIHQFPSTNQSVSLEITSQSSSHVHACFNRYLNQRTFDQLPKATVGLCGYEDSAPTVGKSSYITILSS